MPDELAEARELALQATTDSVTAEEAMEAAEAELTDARERYDAARVAYGNASNIEFAAWQSFKASLRAHRYVETATGPVPADGLHHGTSALPHRLSDCAPDRCGNDAQ